jgi:hypothetical protein
VSSRRPSASARSANTSAAAAIGLAGHYADPIRAVISNAMWRYLLILALAFWLGGLTFYALVVVPIGADILGSTGQGFITQRVTNELNLMGAGVLAMLLANMVKQRGRLLTATWLVLAATQVALVAMHRWLDAMLDASTQEIADGERFYKRHGIYLDVTAVQWAALLVHLWCVQSTSKTSPASDTRTS